MADWVCLDCGTQGPRKARASGTFFGEIAVWIVCIVIAYVTAMAWLLIIAIVYSLARQFTKKRGCAACGSTRVAPFSTPAAQAIVQADRDRTS